LLAATGVAAGCWTSGSAEDDTRDDAGGAIEAEGDVPADADVATIETWMATLIVYAPRGYANDFTETTDDGIGLVGYAMMPDGGFGEGDVWAAKLDAEQNVLWAKVMGGVGSEWVQAVAPAPDGGMVFAAVDRSRYATSAVWVVRLDRNGSILAERLMNGPEEEGAMAIEPLPDGGFVIGGFAGASIEEGDPWLARLDADLNVVWQRRYSTGVGSVRSVARATNGDLLVTTMASRGSPSLWLSRLDEFGGIVWQRLVRGDLRSSASMARSAEMTDGDIVVVGTMAYPLGAFAIRLDAAGDVRWQKILGGAWGCDVAAGDAGEAIISGADEPPFGGGMPNIWLLALSREGGIEWQRTVLGEYIEWGYTAKRGRDGSILVLSADQPSWLLKLRPNGTFENACSIWVRTWAEPTEGTLTISAADFGFVDTTFESVAGSTSSADVPCPMEWVCR
jgi:hypothetical protein